MFIVEMLLIGFIAGGLAKLLMRSSGLGGLLVLGVGGSLIAAGLWYAENQRMSLLPSIVGAVLLLVIYGFTAERPAAPASREDDFRKAA
jgi:uncharacterized membrane protein YeaQ/YmgE (transglycosylase-associated protein family)